MGSDNGKLQEEGRNIERVFSVLLSH